MPSRSKAQQRTMQAAAHNPEFAEKIGIPGGVAKAFTAADVAKGNVGRTADLPERAHTFRDHKQRRSYA